MFYVNITFYQVNTVDFSFAWPSSGWHRKILRKHKFILTKHFQNNIVSITFLLIYNHILGIILQCDVFPWQKC